MCEQRLLIAMDLMNRVVQSLEIASAVENEVCMSPRELNRHGLSNAARGSGYHSYKRFRHGLISSFVGWWFVIEFLPFDGLLHRLNAKHQRAILEYSNRAAGLADNDRDCLGALCDRGCGPVA